MINKFTNQFAFLSNFYPSVILLDNREWPTVEHYYQAMKTLNLIEQERIRKAKSPGEAKRLGQRVTLRANWENIKLQVMKNALLTKFNSHLDLAWKLIETNEHELVEGNYWNDTFWGICNGKGENHLGKLLMEIREELIK